MTNQWGRDLNLQEQRRIYRQACYRIFDSDGIIELRVNNINLALETMLKRLNATCWAFITAHNPRSQAKPATENTLQHQQLVAEVTNLRYHYLLAEGHDNQRLWPPETGLFIIDIPAQTAIALGQKYVQNAILVGQNGRVPTLLFLG